VCVKELILALKGDGKGSVRGKVELTIDMKSSMLLAPREIFRNLPEMSGNFILLVC